MALVAGSRLGPYEVLSVLGTGGMGEVYRARDLKLGRDVALKVLPPAFAANPERLARFEREARVLATLNHPHIAQIYGAIEGPDAAGAPTVHALAMELVEGEDLAQILARGPLPLDEALGVARQIADALEAAHECGVIHRDLKPANVKRRPDGAVKVLDFGLAKLAQLDSDEAGQPSAGGPRLSQSPTIASPALMTSAGMILGTAAYMSPEQARGRPVDKRADIWAFGCVLFETLTGRRAFDGDDLAEVLGAAIHKEPPLDRLPPSTPAHVRTTIERCLQKDPRMRARDIADVRMALEGAFGSATASVAGPARSRSTVLRTAAAIIGAAIAGAGVWMLRPDPPAPPAIHFQVPAPDALRYGGFFTISPNGRLLAFQVLDGPGASSLWIHSLESGQPRRLERAGPVNGSIFFSPDSRFVGYFSSGAIRRIDVSGSPPDEVSRVEGGAGGVWTRDDIILYGRVRGGLLKAPAAGGASVAVTQLDPSREEIGHTNPAMLPDGRHFVYLRTSRNVRNAGIFVGSLDAAPSAQPSQKIVSATEQATFALGADGRDHLLFVRDGVLMAQEFDQASIALRGTPVEIADRIAIGPLGYAQVSVSMSGSLVYRRPDAADGGIPTWFDRSGRALGPVVSTLTTPSLYPRLAPDGKRLALVTANSLWVHDLGGRPSVRLTEGGSLSPLWHPDGRQIVFEQFGRDGPGLQVLPADGGVSTPRQVSPAGHYHAHGFSADGGELLAVKRDDGINAKTFWDIVRLPFPEPAAPIDVVATEALEGFAGAALSPDRRWLAYISDGIGTPELWVRRYPVGATPVRVSPSGATEPVWAQDGRELLYLAGEKLMSVRVTRANSAFEFEPPVVLFEHPVKRSGQPPSYDVAADGRILMLEPVPARPSPIEVLINWHSRLGPTASR